MNFNHCMGYLFLLTIIFHGCYPGSNENNQAVQQMSNREKVKFNQYMVQGKQLYVTHCNNCHQDNGEGVAQLVPPLKNADYMLKNLEKTVCLIRYGIEGPMTVAGKSYNHPMPGNDKLKPLEIAEIVTYVYNSWGNEGGLVSVNDVNPILEGCEKANSLE